MGLDDPVVEPLTQRAEPLLGKTPVVEVETIGPWLLRHVKEPRRSWSVGRCRFQRVSKARFQRATGKSSSTSGGSISSSMISATAPTAQRVVRTFRRKPARRATETLLGAGGGRTLRCRVSSFQPGGNRRVSTAASDDRSNAQVSAGGQARCERARGARGVRRDREHVSGGCRYQARSRRRGRCQGRMVERAGCGRGPRGSLSPRRRIRDRLDQYASFPRREPVAGVQGASARHRLSPRPRAPASRRGRRLGRRLPLDARPRVEAGANCRGRRLGGRRADRGDARRDPRCEVDTPGGGRVPLAVGRPRRDWRVDDDKGGRRSHRAKRPGSSRWRRPI
jgi:hypothetical protein